MASFPTHIKENLKKDKAYYSLYNMDNIIRCKNDPDYLGEVMLVNENLIWHSIHKYVGKPEAIAKYNNIEKDDILQLGRLGFIKAIMAFDVTRGIKFSSFAVTAIVREVRCYLRDSANIIRLTRNAHNLMNEIKRLESDLGYLPSTEDIAILLGVSTDKVEKVLRVGRPVMYLEEALRLGKFSNSTFKPQVCLLDTVGEDVDTEDSVIDKVYIDSIIDSIRDKLSDIELKVLYSQLEGHSQTHTAKEFNISQMRVSRIIKKIASLIRRHMEEKANNLEN